MTLRLCIPFCHARASVGKCLSSLQAARKDKDLAKNSFKSNKGKLSGVESDLSSLKQDINDHVRPCAICFGYMPCLCLAADMHLFMLYEGYHITFQRGSQNHSHLCYIQNFWLH